MTLYRTKEHAVRDIRRFSDIAAKCRANVITAPQLAGHYHERAQVFDALARERMELHGLTLADVMP